MQREHRRTPTPISLTLSATYQTNPLPPPYWKIVFSIAARETSICNSACYYWYEKQSMFWCIQMCCFALRHLSTPDATALTRQTGVCTQPSVGRSFFSITLYKARHTHTHRFPGLFVLPYACALVEQKQARQNSHARWCAHGDVQIMHSTFAQSTMRLLHQAREAPGFSIALCSTGRVPRTQDSIGARFATSLCVCIVCIVFILHFTSSVLIMLSSPLYKLRCRVKVQSHLASQAVVC